MPDMQEDIADHMSLESRHQILRKLSDKITTEDLELIYARFPAVLDEALHEILNAPTPLPDVETIRTLLRVTPEPACLAHWQPLPCLFCQEEVREA